ncbi:MAG TPA: hypothetical protein VGL13_15585 [Polyangiaceae bacterium]|jgi:hypothetical protein
MAVEIREIPLGGDLRPFLGVVEYIYRDDPAYVRPLDLDLKDRLSRKNPFFAHADGTCFVAMRNDKPVGRITAQIDRAHLDRYKDGAGFFGFLDTVDDSEVAGALLDTASQWLKRRGMEKIRGPLSLNINEELGCLIEGFDTPPMILMPHHRPYQGGLIEKAGLPKLKDFYAWRYTVGDVPPRAVRAHDEVAGLPEVRTRTLDVKRIEEEARVVMDIFNDAWSDNWYAVPFSEAELRKFAADMKLLLIPELTRLILIDGEPAAFAIALPNLNEMIADLKGKLFPLGLGKILWRLKVEGPKTARLVLLGIRKKYRHVRKYAGLSTHMYVEMNRAGQKLGLKWGELSWTVEDNAPVNVGIKFMGGKIYKKYRVYERGL